MPFVFRVDIYFEEGAHTYVALNKNMCFPVDIEGGGTHTNTRIPLTNILFYRVIIMF